MTSPTLFTSLVVAEGATPTRSMLFLHGILGSGSNFRTLARRFVSHRPDWAAVLVDLRLHGQSQGFSAPHTIATSARDVLALCRRPDWPRVEGILGHSFGGKVALECVRALDGDLANAFVIDSTPSARPDARGSESTKHVVDLLDALPEEFVSREQFVSWLESRGLTRDIVMWLAMNVRPIAGTNRFAFRLDIPSIRTLLDDYFVTDSWDVLEHPRGRVTFEFVVGDRSTVVDERDRDRARSIAAARPDRVHLHIIENAGHWVHVDAPSRLEALLVAESG